MKHQYYFHETLTHDYEISILFPWKTNTNTLESYKNQRKINTIFMEHIITHRILIILFGTYDSYNINSISMESEHINSATLISFIWNT